MEKKKINENMVDDFYNVKQSVVDSIKTALKDGKELDDAISEALDTLIYTDDQWAIIQHYLTPDQTLDEGHTLIGIAEELFYNELYNEWQDYEDDEDVSWDEKTNAYKGELPWDSSKHFDDDDDIDESLSNQLDESVSKDAQEVVNPVMADALRDQEKAEEVKEKATEITKDGKPTIKNESLATFDPFSALGKLEENIKRGI